MKEKNSALLNSELLTALPELSDWQPKPLEFTLKLMRAKPIEWQPF